jgi:hypothetical protein
MLKIITVREASNGKGILVRILQKIVVQLRYITYPQKKQVGRRIAHDGSLLVRLLDQKKK